jgi:glycosyltransferase involved in cell wall biosynthesis
MADELSDGIQVSVIVPTRNRSAMLKDVVEALWAQSFPKDRLEILVMDNCSTDDTPETMAELQRRSPCRLVYHVMPENRGPARSRNTGASRARGHILAFTDDDCRPAPDWLARGVAGFQDSVGFVCGQVRYKPEQLPTAGFFSRDGRAVLAEHPTYTWSNILYRRDVFEEMGGSDESLCLPDLRNRVVDCGDTDLAWRVKERGYRSVFLPEMVVYHELEQLTPLNWVFEPYRLFVVAELLRRHPVLRERLLLWRLFFAPANLLLYLALAGLVLGLLLHPAFLALAAAYPAWALWLLRPALTGKGLPKVPAQVLFLTARQLMLCAGLIYGSFRFRCLVL